MRQLKTCQHTTWWIRLNSLALLTDINECQVESLYMMDTHLDSNCVNQLIQEVTCNKTLEGLFLSSSPLLPDTYQLLTTNLINNKIIKYLYLYDDKNISDKDVPHLSHLITNNRTLQSLHLIKCTNITKFGKQQLQKVSVKNNSLKSLYVNGNKLC